MTARPGHRDNRRLEWKLGSVDVIDAHTRQRVGIEDHSIYAYHGQGAGGRRSVWGRDSLVNCNRHGESNARRTMKGVITGEHASHGVFSIS